MTSAPVTNRHPLNLPDGAVGGLCVLASGSRGNCSVLVVPDGGTRRIVLIDAGLSPRRTQRLLADYDIGLWEIDAVVLTHLDTDHAHLGWAKSKSLRAPFYIHASHRGRAERLGLAHKHTRPFRSAFEIGNRISIDPVLLEHDSLGVAVFRISIADERTDQHAVLCYATDVGRPSQTLARHIHDADTLAIESNYCTNLQQNSDRPAFLKRRIMGGSGHLSNQQCFELAQKAAPRSDLICLHLSQQCNDPALVQDLHQNAPYSVTLSTQHEPTNWVWIQPSRSSPITPVAQENEDLPLWSTEVGP